MTNIYAHTAPGCNYPEFISINLDDEQNAHVLVRSKAKADGSCGETSEIVLSPQELHDLAYRLFCFSCTNAA